MLGAGGADAEPFVAKPNQIEPIGVDQDAERQTLSLRTFCSERVAASAASKPRSRLRALAEGTERGLGTFPLLLRKMAEIEREGNGEIDADAARAASYALGARGAPLADAFASAVTRDVAARAFADGLSSVPKKKAFPDPLAEMPPLRLAPEASLPLGALLLLESSRAVTATVDALIARDVEGNFDAAKEKAGLALGACAHALSLVDPEDPAARAAAPPAAAARRRRRRRGSGSSSHWRARRSPRARSSSPRRACARSRTRSGWLRALRRFHERGRVRRGDGTRACPPVHRRLRRRVRRARESAVVAAAPRAFLETRAVPVPEGSGSLAEIRERLFRVAQTHGIDATRVAVAHAAALLAAAVPSSPGGPRESGTNDSRSSQQKIALEAARDATRDLERRFAADPEGARAGLVREAWPVLSGRAFKPNDTSSDGSNTTQSAPCASGDAFAAYFAWIRACRLSSSASCFRAARDFAARGDAEAEAREEAEAKLHARRADAADAAATTAKALAAMVRRAAGSCPPGAVRVEAFLAREAHDAPPGGARGFVAALAEALAPAAAAAPASSAAAAAAVTRPARWRAPCPPRPLCPPRSPSSPRRLGGGCGGGDGDVCARPGPGKQEDPRRARALGRRRRALTRHASGGRLRLRAPRGVRDGAAPVREVVFFSFVFSFQRRRNETRPKRFGASFASEAALGASRRARRRREAPRRARRGGFVVEKRTHPRSSSPRAPRWRALAGRRRAGRAACARRRRAGGARSRRRFSETETDSPGVVRDAFFSSATNGAARRFAALGASAHAMFGFEESTRDGARAARVVFRRRPRARHRRARRDGGARRRRRRRNARRRRRRLLGRARRVRPRRAASPPWRAATAS